MKREGVVRGVAWMLGFLAVVTQTVLLREFLGVAEGNELVLGLVLAFWMALTGVGAYLARRPAALRTAGIGWSLVVLGALPLVTAVALRAARRLLFSPGTMLGLWETAALAAVLLSPFCLLAGSTFVRLAELFRSEGRSIASAYGWEATGSLAGGVVGYLITGTGLSNIAVLAGLALAGSLASALLLSTAASRWIPGRPAVLISGGLLCFAGSIDQATRALLLPGQAVEFARDTPYGSLVVAERDGQKSLFENGILITSTGDVVGREESVHFAMVQRTVPGRVLVVSGAASGVLEEVLKYPVEQVDYVELNPAVHDAGPYLGHSPSDLRVSVVEGDVRTVLRSSKKSYDVLLLNTPDPTTAQSNRLFTLEFLRLARSRMNDSSVLSISLLPTVEYYGSRARLVASSVYGTLRAVFPCVIVIPGGRNYFIASATPLEYGIARLVRQRHVPTLAVNAYYIDDEMLKERGERFVGSLDTLGMVNRDLRPVAYYRQIAFWLESIGVSADVVGILAVLLALGGFVVVSRVGIGVYAGGFAAAGIEVVVLLGYQSLYGFVYRSMWLVIGCCMGGLAAGAALSTYATERTARRWFLAALVVLAACALLLVLLLERLVGSTRAEVEGVVGLLGVIVLSGAAAGVVFGSGVLLARGETRQIAGGMYAADLAGSALGSLLSAVYLVPMLGTGLAAACLGLFALLAVGVNAVAGPIRTN